jgi:putative hydrolase of HD superfamily
MQLGDLEAFEHWLHPDNEWRKLDGPYYPQIKLEDIPKIIKKCKEIINEADYPTPRTRFVVADKETDQLLGHVNSYWISKETNWLAIGIVIYDPQNWQKEIGTEALSLWCDYLFSSKLDIVRLDMRTWSGNHGMMALAEKLGFKLEAVFRKARIVNGKYYDGIAYGILKEEWGFSD